MTPPPRRVPGLKQEKIMDRNLFQIVRTETVKPAFFGRAYVSVSFALEYKGVEINRFPSLEAAEDCVAEAVAIRSDAQWAFEDALRNAGHDIPGE